MILFLALLRQYSQDFPQAWRQIAATDREKTYFGRMLLPHCWFHCGRGRSHMGIIEISNHHRRVMAAGERRGFIGLIILLEEISKMELEGDCLRNLFPAGMVYLC